MGPHYFLFACIFILDKVFITDPINITKLAFKWNVERYEIIFEKNLPEIEQPPFWNRALHFVHFNTNVKLY